LSGGGRQSLVIGRRVGCWVGRQKCGRRLPVVAGRCQLPLVGWTSIVDTYFLLNRTSRRLPGRWLSVAGGQVVKSKGDTD